METTPVSPMVTTNNSTDDVTTNNDSAFTDYEHYNSFEDNQIYDVARFINTYYLYLVCVIGLPGNIACIATLTYMRPIVSSAIYMIALAIVDFIALVLKMLYLQLTKYDIELGSNGCRLLFLFGSVSQQFSNWILIALTMERFTAIWFPFKVKKISTSRTALVVLFIMLLTIILANLQFVFTFEEAEDPWSGWACQPKEKFVHFVHFVWYWIDGLLYAFLPMIFILVFNGLIIYAIHKAARNKRHWTGRAQNRNNGGSGSQHKQITMMLTSISVVFVLLVLPNCIFFIVQRYWTWQETELGTVQYYLVYQIVFLLSDLNHAINFYLYCLCGSKFRAKFAQLCCCCCCCRRRVHVSTGSGRPASHRAINRSSHTIVASTVERHNNSARIYRNRTENLRDNGEMHVHSGHI